MLLFSKGHQLPLQELCVFVRLENVGRLKKLEYLNLALNNIEVIENLEGQCIAYVWALIQRLFFCL